MILTFPELRKSRKQYQFKKKKKKSSNTQIVNDLDKVITNFAKIEVKKEACRIHARIINKILSNKLITVDNRL